MKHLLILLAVLALCLDWLQTRYIAKHPDKFHELNPILGLHPAPWKVNVYFVLCIVIAVGAAYFHWGFAVFVLLVESVVVVRNAQLGIRLT